MLQARGNNVNGSTRIIGINALEASDSSDDGHGVGDITSGNIIGDVTVLNADLSDGSSSSITQQIGAQVTVVQTDNDNDNEHYITVTGKLNFEKYY